jgi:type IV pilus assembly protein PilB
MARVPIGKMLVEQGRIDDSQLKVALAHQRQWGGRVGEAMVCLGFLAEQELHHALARQHGVPYLTLGDRQVAPGVLRLLPERLIRQRKVFPLAVLSASRRGQLVVATADPGDIAALDEVAFASGMAVRVVLATAADIDRAIARHLDGAVAPPPRPQAVDLPRADEYMQVVPFAHGLH